LTAQYCGLVTQTGWPERLAHVIAAEVRRYRKDRRLSAQQLSDRCAKLGMEIPRSTLADLENGRRSKVTVAELLVLAAALDIPPVLLVAPLGRQPKSEILPGRELPTRDAVLWLSGVDGLSETPVGCDTAWLSWRDKRGIVALYDRHAAMVDDVQAVMKAGHAETLSTADGTVVMTAADLRDRAVEELRNVRAEMRERELILPDLPQGLADIDQERPRRRRR
jgi:transcriptional regulator with XRE-family HTH domain